MSTFDSSLTRDNRSHQRKTAGPLTASPSSSSSSLLWSSSVASSCIHCPTNRLLSELQRKRRRKKCNDEESAIQPLQELTSTYTTKPVTMETRYSSPTKRTPDGVLDKSDNDLLWQKSSELQRFVPPLSSILRRLRSGRYSHRLSSFQESVAMDRIQRILRVLQNPDRSERFLAMLGKIEEMLQSWFPHIKASQSDEHAPVKKKKLHHGASSSYSSPPSLTSSSFTHLKWTHTSPICSLKTPESLLGGALQVQASIFHQVAMQDSAVSSTTDSSHLSLRRGPPPAFCFRSPCLERLLQAKESVIASSAPSEGGAKIP